MADRHVQEARELSFQLGGTDLAVKKYLFRLSEDELDNVLTQYRRNYGASAASYARRALPLWKTGRTRMSGLVMGRLYSLLPPMMPINTKYEIAEELWKRVGPSSSKALRFGPWVTVEEIVANVEEHISNVVVEYRIPDGLTRRFNWLSSDDVNEKQQMLNHFRSLDKSLLVEAVRLQAGVMVQHLYNDQDGQTNLFTHTVTVGKHNLKMVADKDAQGCVFEAFNAHAQPVRRHSLKSGNNFTWLWWIVVAAVIAGIVFFNS